MIRGSTPSLRVQAAANGRCWSLVYNMYSLYLYTVHIHMRKITTISSRFGFIHIAMFGRCKEHGCIQHLFCTSYKHHQSCWICLVGDFWHGLYQGMIVTMKNPKLGESSWSIFQASQANLSVDKPLRIQFSSRNNLVGLMVLINPIYPGHTIGFLGNSLLRTYTRWLFKYSLCSPLPAEGSHFDYIIFFNWIQLG